MSSTAVITVRVPRWVKEEIEKLGIDYAEEIREYLIRRVREEGLRRVARQMDEMRRRTKGLQGNVSAELIRESRDKGWSE